MAQSEERLTLPESRIGVTDTHIVRKDNNGEVQFRIPIESINSITLSRKFNPVGIGMICASAVCIFLAFWVSSSTWLTWGLAIIAALLLLVGLLVFFETCLCIFFKQDFPNSKTSLSFARSDEMQTFIVYIRDRLYSN